MEASSPSFDHQITRIGTSHDPTPTQRSLSAVRVRAVKASQQGARRLIRKSGSGGALDHNPARAPLHGDVVA
jgi:hypothetical protein